MANVMTEKDLREQIHQEIENKAKCCSNPTYECSLPRVDGYEYCMRHILRDSRGNFRQCTFAYSNGRKCTNALPKYDLKKDPSMTTYCFEHSRQVQLRKTHSAVGKLRRIDTNDALLNSLSHHLHIEESIEKANVCEQDEEIDVVSPHVAPFISHDQTHNLSAVTAALRKRRRVLDYASDSSSLDDEPPTLKNTLRGFEYNESDMESVDSQDEDQLKHAGIFTREEVLRIAESKHTKLQSLYIEQINRLHHLLKEKRRRYLTDIRKERETLISIHEQVKDTPRERELYDQLKALNSYHRRHGQDAILYKKFKEKRSRHTEGYGHKGPGFIKCVFTEGGVKCGERVMPCSKYCRKHILEDKKQILFRACNVEKSGVVCQEPVPYLFDDSTCVLHLKMPVHRQFVQKKFDSESEEEDIEVKKESVDMLEQKESAIKEEQPEVKDNSMNPAGQVDAHQTSESCNVTIAHESPEDKALLPK